MGQKIPAMQGVFNARLAAGGAIASTSAPQSSDAEERNIFPTLKEVPGEVP